MKAECFESNLIQKTIAEPVTLFVFVGIVSRERLVFYSAKVCVAKSTEHITYVTIMEMLFLFS